MFFVFHGSLDNSKSIGTNRMIRDIAKIAICPQDVIEQYKILHKVKLKPKVAITQEEAKMQDIPIEYRKIYKVITQEPMDINDIAKLSNTEMQDAMSKLTMLELEGKVKKLSGNMYVRI